MGVAHGDVKPDNLLLGADGCAASPATLRKPVALDPLMLKGI